MRPVDPDAPSVLMRLNNEATNSIRSLSRSVVAAEQHNRTVHGQWRDAVRALAARVNEPIALCDAAGRIEWSNRAFAALGPKDALTVMQVASLAPNAFETLVDADAEPRLLAATLAGAPATLTLIPRESGWIVLCPATDVGHPEIALLSELNNEVVNKTREIGRQNGLLRGARAEIEARNEELRRLATTDVLTGIPNRQWLLAWLETEWRDLERHGAPLAIALGDIDHFKLFNDRYGHRTGDAVLRHVAQTLVSSVRRGDVVARFGGEEFVVVIHGCDATSAFEAVDRIRRDVANSLLRVQDQQHAVTLSLGIALVATPSMTVEQALHQADESMYAAKAAGRNRVVLHPLD